MSLRRNLVTGSVRCFQVSNRKTLLLILAGNYCKPMFESLESIVGPFTRYVVYVKCWSGKGPVV